MAANRHTDVEPPASRHEERDVNVWAVGKFAIALVIVCIAACALLVGLFHYYLSEYGGPVVGTEGSVRLPPEPRLETSPPIELGAFRADEDQRLNTYGWIDRQKGVVRIPISRAIDLLAQRGLPSRAQNGAVSASTASVPTESSLGPRMQPPGGPLSGDQK